MVGNCDPPKEHQFKPGQSGNPAGLPKGFRSFKTRIRELADKEIDYKDLDNKKIRTTAGDAVITALYGKAVYKQDVQAAKIIMEHVEGASFNLTSQETDEELDARILELLDKAGEIKAGRVIREEADQVSKNQPE